MKDFENKLRWLVRDSIADVAPENVDAVVDSILSDMLGGASLALEKIISEIDDSMGFYEIRSKMFDFKGNVDLLLLQITKPFS